MQNHVQRYIKKLKSILIIQQKSCQTINLLIMSEMMILGGAKKCANPHVFCAITHTFSAGFVKMYKIAFWFLYKYHVVSLWKKSEIMHHFFRFLEKLYNYFQNVKAIEGKREGDWDVFSNFIFQSHINSLT